VLGHPKTKLEFLKQRWIASNTQLAGVLVAGGFLVVPRDGKWSDARGFLVFFGVVAMIGMVIFVNVSEFERRSASLSFLRSSLAELTSPPSVSLDQATTKHPIVNGLG